MCVQTQHGCVCAAVKLAVNEIKWRTDYSRIAFWGFSKSRNKEFEIPRCRLQGPLTFLRVNNREGPLR